MARAWPRAGVQALMAHTPTLGSPLPVCSGTNRVSSNAEPIVMGSSCSQALKELYFLTSLISTFNTWRLPGISTALCHCLLWHCIQKDLVSQRGGHTNQRLLLEAVRQETRVWILRHISFTSLCLSFPTCKMGNANSLQRARQAHNGGSDTGSENGRWMKGWISQ